MIKRYDLINVPCHGGWDSYDELQEVEDGDWVRYDDHAAELERLSTEGLHHAALSIATSNALPDLLSELHTLRARVAELEEENEQLRWVVRASCVRRPTPGCDCPGCETARERAAQVGIVESYEAELEEDRQAERDRILGARVREIACQHDVRTHDASLDLYGFARFARDVVRAMEEVDDA